MNEYKPMWTKKEIVEADILLKTFMHIKKKNAKPILKKATASFWYNIGWCFTYNFNSGQNFWIIPTFLNVIYRNTILIFSIPPIPRFRQL